MVSASTEICRTLYSIPQNQHSFEAFTDIYKKIDHVFGHKAISKKFRVCPLQIVQFSQNSNFKIKLTLLCIGNL